MMYLQKTFTVPAAPSKITACEACVYGRGAHAWWCPERRCICGAPCSPGQKCFNCGYTVEHIREVIEAADEHPAVYRRGRKLVAGKRFEEPL